VLARLGDHAGHIRLTGAKPLGEELGAL